LHLLCWQFWCICVLSRCNPYGVRSPVGVAIKSDADTGLERWVTPFRRGRAQPKRQASGRGEDGSATGHTIICIVNSVKARTILSQAQIECEYI
jgi:hypothetical protein